MQSSWRCLCARGGEPFEQRHLRRIDLLSRFPDRDPLRAVDFGDLDPPPRPGRPLYLAGVAGDGVGVEVALEGVRVDGLASFLPDLPQVLNRSRRRRDAELLLELPAGRGQRI